MIGRCQWCKKQRKLYACGLADPDSTKSLLCKKCSELWLMELFRLLGDLSCSPKKEKK